MTGNLSRTVLRGAGARESACLPDYLLVRCFLIFMFIHNTLSHILCYTNRSKNRKLFSLHSYSFTFVDHVKA
ncbi:hypothetical protein C1N68_27290 (plasmid) [Priestia aryabhattai]